MKHDEQIDHTIGEASRRAGIPGQTLRRWCDSGRIECRRDDNGYRLLSESTVEELCRHGLAAFQPANRESREQGSRQQAKPSPCERLGLLGEPSPQLRQLKEQLEGTKMQLELAQVRSQLDELSRQRDEQARQLQAEEEVLIEKEEAEREREDLRLRESLRQAQERERRLAWERERGRWVKEQLRRAGTDLRQKALWLDLTGSELNQTLTHLSESLTERLDYFSHDSALHEVLKVQEETVNQLLRPFEVRKAQNRIIERCRMELRTYLKEQSGRGWLNIGGTDIDFLARQIEQPVMAIVEKEVWSKGLSEEQAKECLHKVLDHRLNLI